MNEKVETARANGMLESRAPSRLGVLDGLSLSVAALMTATSVAGLFVDHLYRDNTWSTAAYRGTDAATLALAVPTLVVALLLARRGSMRARLVWLGVLAYNVYNYGFYLFGTAFNDAFLLYCAGWGLSIAVLVFAVPRVLPGVAAVATAPFRVVGGYLVVVGVAFGVVWSAQSAYYLLNDQLPTVIADSGIHTSIVFALDLSLLVPWLVIGGVLLCRRTRAGIALGVVMNVLAVLYMTALAVSGSFMGNAGIPGASWSTPPYLEIGIGSILALAWLLPKVTTGGEHA